MVAISGPLLKAAEEHSPQLAGPCDVPGTYRM